MYFKALSEPDMTTRYLSMDDLAVMTRNLRLPNNSTTHPWWWRWGQQQQVVVTQHQDLMAPFGIGATEGRRKNQLQVDRQCWHLHSAGWAGCWVRAARSAPLILHHRFVQLSCQPAPSFHFPHPFFRLKSKYTNFTSNTLHTFSWCYGHCKSFCTDLMCCSDKCIYKYK